MDLITEINSLKADYNAAQSLLNEVQASVAGFQTQLSAKDADLLAKQAELDAAKQQHASDIQALAEKVAELATVKGELETFKASQKTAAEIAVEQLAQVGAKPMAAPADSAEESKVTTREEALTAWSNAQGAKAKAEVWARYKSLLSNR